MCTVTQLYGLESGVPGPTPLDGLNCPPFGMGTGRRFSGQVLGYSDTGIPYQAFDYDSSTFGAYGAVGAMRIPVSLPPFFASLPTNPRPGVVGFQVPNDAGLLLVTEDESFGWAVVEHLLPSLTAFARRRPLDIAIDGDSLTVQQIPTGAPAVHAYMNDLAVVAQAVAAAAGPLSRFQRPKVPGLSFYGRPDWAYLPRDDRILATAPVTRGRGSRTSDLVVSPSSGGVQTVGFTHSFEVTVSSGDSQSTRTDHEYVTQTSLPFQFGRVAVDWRGFAAPLIFHLPEFDDSHTVYADDRPFATEVCRPLLRWLASMNPPPFAIQGGYVWMRPPTKPDIEAVEWCHRFVLEFFARVSHKVWHHLGLPGNPVGVSLR